MPTMVSVNTFLMSLLPQSLVLSLNVNFVDYIRVTQTSTYVTRDTWYDFGGYY